MRNYILFLGLITFYCFGLLVAGLFFDYAIPLSIMVFIFALLVFLEKELAGVNHSQDCSRELLDVCENCGIAKRFHNRFNKGIIYDPPNYTDCKKFKQKSDVCEEGGK